MTWNHPCKLVGASAADRAAYKIVARTRFLSRWTTSDIGDVIYDLPAPIMVRGHHGGHVRIGYRRSA